MGLAKGLEFRAVVVMACDEGILPLDERVADAAMKPNSTRSMRRSDACCMLPARERESIYCLPARRRHQNSSPISPQHADERPAAPLNRDGL